jgi:bifunctional DNA-binding transcriptional regulator/antitoxin component of YhaV-PrlF toxin-antitoxin module
MEEPKRATTQIIARETGNGSIEITIPKGICPRLEIEPGTELEIEVEDKKHGPFLAIWNYKQQKQNYYKEHPEDKDNTADKYDRVLGETWKGAYKDMKADPKNYKQ